MKLILDDGVEIEVRSLKVVQTQPGDVLVLRTKHALTAEVSERLSRRVGGILPGVKVLILEMNTSIEIVRQRCAAELREEWIGGDSLPRHLEEGYGG